MKNLTGSQVRQLFLDYFKEKGHMVEPGASLVPHNDATLLWINSGVAALKKYFDGSQTPTSNRICNAQKSIRTNDIENVGKTARHHTFFEMLGNFSIGDYFKEDALKFAWEFLTDEKWIGFDKEKMYVTVYIDDQVAYDIWVNDLKIDPTHILRTPHNFWEIGDGPSGPNSEFFYDRGPQYDPENIGEKLFFEEIDNDRYIEVWNVVFSQYDAKTGVDRKDYKELPQRNIDTGMGLERLVCLIQNGETNFDTDLFMPIINECAKLSKFEYAGEYKMAYRVIADHIRTVTFALADGASFSNDGRGYVLRRVLRRAVRYGIKLGISEAFIYKLVGVVASTMEDFYPYVNAKVELISKLVKNEEEAFHSTLYKGEKLLMSEINSATNKVLSGAVMFKLYDTYGFPKELTTEICEELNVNVDLQGFEEEMNMQKQRAKNARNDEQSMNSQSIELMKFNEESKFIGYDKIKCESTVIALFKDGIQVKSIEDIGEVILDQTCFYAESGGQVGDTGVIYSDSFSGEILDCKKAPNGQHLHKIKITSGMIKNNDVVQCEIDEIKRLKIKANHSSLHLLQSALINVIGDHIHQAGSYVCDSYARFDFSHFEKVSDTQLEQIELLVNQKIMADNPVITQVLTVAEAKQTNAIALFDEKYGDFVRVVNMNEQSVEFCGGTHVSNTQEIGLFKITSEESIGSGIRRISIKTKLDAYNDLNDSLTTLKVIAKKLKMNGLVNVDEKVMQVIDENSSLKKQLAKLNLDMMVLKADSMVQEAVAVNNINTIIKRIDNCDGASLKNLAEILRNKCTNSFVFLAGVDDGKAIYVSACTKFVTDLGFKAGDMVKLAASLSDGKGGGRPDLAQAGGKDVSKVDEILLLINDKIAQVI